MGSWTKEEIEVTVTDYLDMLEAEQAGDEYEKSKHRRLLASLLDERTESAIEWKHQNISAVLIKHGYPYIAGYKPKWNFQGLLEEIVLYEIGRRDIQHATPERSKYPLRAFSWELLSPSVAIKTMDKSAFLHHGASVPGEIVFFFDYTHIPEHKDIILDHDGNQCPATLTFDAVNQRVRLFWRGTFSKIISEKLPHHFAMYSEGIEPTDNIPEMRFCKDTDKGDDVYSVEFIDPSPIALDSVCFDEDIVPTDGNREGAPKQKTTTVYERDPSNRLAAIRMHGSKCIVCGFDFRAVYGEWGGNYIEVHHVTPLFEKNGEHVPNIETDLVPVCANCHRMIHRERSNVIGIDRLRAIINAAMVKPGY